MTLHVQVNNPTVKEVIVIPSIHRAKTNSIGVVEYTNSSEKCEIQGQENIEEVATIKEKEINLNPKKHIIWKYTYLCQKRNLKGSKLEQFDYSKKILENKLGMFEICLHEKLG